MASGILLFIFHVIYISAGTGFVSLSCNTQKEGQYGQSSLLECVIKHSSVVRDLEIRQVTWRKAKDKEPLLVFYRGKTSPRQGYSFAEPSWNDRNLNVSLLITNTGVQDEGAYTCQVTTDSGGSESKPILLKVTAKYNFPTLILESETENTHRTLVCKSDDGYPEGQLRWFDKNNNEHTQDAVLEMKQPQSRLFELSSKLRLKKESITGYTCAVFSSNGTKLHEVTFTESAKGSRSIGTDHKKELNSSIKTIVAPVVVIGSLIVGLLLAVLIYRKKKKGYQQEVPQSEYNYSMHNDQEKINNTP